MRSFKHAALPLLLTLALPAALVAQAGAKPAPKPAPKAAATTTAQAKPAGLKVREAKPGLLKQATITPEAAEQSAIALVPGGKATSATIEEMNGALTYVFTVHGAGKMAISHVTVDAKTGAAAIEAAKPKAAPKTPAPKKSGGNPTR